MKQPVTTELLFMTTLKELTEPNPSNPERETVSIIADYTLFHDEKGYWHLLKSNMGVSKDKDNVEVIGDSEELFDLFRILHQEHTENHKRFFNL